VGSIVGNLLACPEMCLAGVVVALRSNH